MEEYQYTTEAIDKYYNGADQWKVISNHNITPEDAETVLGNIQGVDVVKSANGKVLSYNFKASENVASEAAEAVNSNVPPNVKSFDIPANTAVDTAGKMTFTSGMSQAGNFVFTKVVPAIAAVGAGITLGKLFDKVLYNANPDFWDEHGMSTLDPDTWGDIIGTDSFGGRVMNMILGTTPDGKTQAYIDQNALAYMALYMKNKGAFNDGKLSSDELKIDDNITIPANLGRIDGTTHKFRNNYTSCVDGILGTYDGNYIRNYNSTENSNVRNTIVRQGNDLYFIMSSNDSNINRSSWGTYYFSPSDPTLPSGGLGSSSAQEKTIDGKTVIYKNNNFINAYINGGINKCNLLINPVTVEKNALPYIGWALWYGTWSSESSIDGIGTQDNAKTPDLSNADTVQEALDALKQQYPELFQNSVTQDVVQPDGSTVTYTYVPIAVPELDPEGNPISSPELDPEGNPIGSTQANPQIDPATAPEPLLKLITTLIQKDPPINPPDTGSGYAPAVVPPSGSASALYAIYNPTLAQINAFGAWLWSDNFIDQIKKLFNDPMQAIIGLHKVYATPATSGSQTIKVGYLDSGVSANVVSNQYTTVDCGTVTLSEYFHNVFDYSPYTQINLYLPFIGIVSLDNADVMRASIHIVYHVDVLSGACLAEVKVTRDGAGGTLYQYTGNASVTLPISSGSYMGIVSSIASIAGGIAGTIASGGTALPMIASAAGSALTARAKVEHSGSFSGNSGAMGGKIPYLIISRPQVALANNFQKYIGFPANYTTKLSNCSGFVKVLECHIENVNATSSELTEIESLLKGGIIV